MAVDARAGHGQAIHVLVLICSLPKQSESLGILTEDTNQGDLVFLVSVKHCKNIREFRVQDTETRWPW